MARRVREPGCCASSEASSDFQDRLDLARRRLILIRRVVATGAVATCAVALLLWMAPWPAAEQAAHRTAWAAAAWGLPRLLGHARAALAARKITLPLALAAALAAIGVMGLPFVTAAAVAAVLVTDVVRRPVDPPGESRHACDSVAAVDQRQRVKG